MVKLKPDAQFDIIYAEDGIIPGRPLPSEFHAEPHTDYDGATVK